MKNIFSLFILAAMAMFVACEKPNDIANFKITSGKEYIVESGLIEGDTIVVEGIGLLRDDTPIKIKEIISGSKKKKK